MAAVVFPENVSTFKCMKRRLFVKSSLITASAGSMAGIITQAASGKDIQKPSTGECYELRVYSIQNEVQQKRVEDYFQKAAIPALNRLGSKNIGVFREYQPKEQTKIYAVIPFTSVEDMITMEDKLFEDAAYISAGAAYLNAPATDPAYVRIESSLLRAFSGMPKLVVPPDKPRLFELRRYESSGESAGKKKIEMFNKGEIAIFKRVGLTPVFFGETIIGGVRPNLTYMITFDDMAEHDRNWKQFGGDPEWKTLKSIPEYMDAKIVSKITATFLIPTEFSQI